MVKIKPEESNTYISFTIAPSMKAKWVAYAKELGLPLARVIKETMNRVINTPIEKKESNNNEMIYNFLFEINKKIENLQHPTESNVVITQDEIKHRILMFLNDFSNGLELDVLSKYVNVESKIIQKALEKLEEEEVIKHVGKRYIS